MTKKAKNGQRTDRKPDRAVQSDAKNVSKPVQRNGGPVRAPAPVRKDGKAKGVAAPVHVGVVREEAAKGGQRRAASTAAALGQTPGASPYGHRWIPKKHPPGSLKRGDMVWYRGERWWIERVPPNWDESVFMRIANKKVHPDPERDLLHGVDHVSFCVHPDFVDLAPPVRNEYADRLPTKHAVEQRAEQKRTGVRDVADEVALLLRDAEGLDGVYKVGAKYLSVPEVELRSKYGHLNNGQQRMNVGNRMRALWRKNHGK